MIKLYLEILINYNFYNYIFKVEYILSYNNINKTIMFNDLSNIALIQMINIH